jgi:LPXTG-motif cell wall-anchored protein
VAPTAAFAAVPNLHLGRAADVIDAVPVKTVLDTEVPTVEVKVTNSTGKEATLQGWLNDVPGEEMAVPARSATVTLTFPAMTEGQARLTLSLTADGVQDVEVHDVVLMSRDYGYHSSPTPGTTPTVGTSMSPKPWPSWSKSPKPKPSWSKSPKPSGSYTPTPSMSESELPKTGDSVSSYMLLGGGLLVFGIFILGLAWALGRRTASESATEG